MTAGDDDWPEVAGNLAKAQKSWGRLQRILSREGATPRISGSFFKAVVQQVWGRDMGGNSKDGSGAEQVPPWGGKADH